MVKKAREPNEVGQGYGSSERPGPEDARVERDNDARGQVQTTSRSSVDGTRW